MPAQWPIFINNLSKKLVSRNSTGPDHFGEFVANEYFNAVKTSQTVFGNIHQSGQKSILDAAFKKAFNMLYDSTTPMLDDKFENPIYADLLESFPKINLKQDPLCDMEKWIESSADTIEPFQFFQFFPSTCPIESPTEEDVFGDIEITTDNIDTKANEVEQKYVTFRVNGGDGVSPYTIEYMFNGEIFSITTDDTGVARVDIPTGPGEYSYTFLSAIDTSKRVELKNVDKTASLKIDEGGTLSEVVISPNSTRELVKPMNEEKKVNEIAKRVLMQNDGTEYFERWIKNIGVNGADSLIKKIKAKVLGWLEDGTTFPINLNVRIFQEQHSTMPAQIPDWLTESLIIKCTYDKSVNKYQDRFDYIKSHPSDPIGVFYGAYIKQRDKSALNSKKEKYKAEEDRFNELKKRWIKEISDAEMMEEGGCSGNDAYCVMADGIIKYWKSCATKPFAPTPPILPCNVPSPGIFTPISYGSKEQLANDLRRAWNTGKRFKSQPGLNPAAKAVSTAVAVACAKHLKNLKFVYVGKLTVGTSTIPMVGISPTTF